MTIDEAIKTIIDDIQIDLRFCTTEDVQRFSDALYLALTALEEKRERDASAISGTWQHTPTSVDWFTPCLKCSICGYEDDGGNCYPYCPECGAKMEG